MRACGNNNAKNKHDKTKSDELERHGSVYAHTRVSMFMRHSGQLFGTKEGTKFRCSWPQSGDSLKQPCFSTDSKGTAMQKPGNKANAFGLREVVRKVESEKGLENSMFSPRSHHCMNNKFRAHLETDKGSFVLIPHLETSLPACQQGLSLCHQAIHTVP